MATKKKNAPKTLKWKTPGAAIATLYFSDIEDLRAIFVSLMPGFESTQSVSALIGDSITEDDFMNINHFEQVLPRIGSEHQFVTAAFVNRSTAEVNFELVFVFSGDDRTQQRYGVKLGKNASEVLFIPTKLSN